MNKLAWYISLAITMFGFILINTLFTLDPHEKTTNLNPAFLPIVFVLPFLCLSVFITYMVGKSFVTNMTMKQKIWTVVGLLLVICVSIMNEINLIHKSLEAFQGGIHNENSTIYKLNYINSYTNHWYFNEASFLLLHSVAFLSSFITKKRKEK